MRVSRFLLLGSYYDAVGCQCLLAARFLDSDFTALRNEKSSNAKGRVMNEPDSDPAPDTRFVRIWQVVAAIPVGRVMSYGAVAEAAGMPRRARFVSRALRCAPESMALPWHRVVRACGGIAFEPDSEAFHKQQALLRAEGVNVCNGRVDKAVNKDSFDLDRILWSQE